MAPASLSARSNPPAVVFTDLDGTLLDHHVYSWQTAAATVERLKRHGIPLVLASSKTRAEMLALRLDLGIADPFIVENGAAIYWGAESDLEVEILGRPRDEILKILHEIRERRGLDFEGFADWDVAGIQKHTSLDAESARAAGERDGTEPILWLDVERAASESAELAEELARHDLRLVRGGRFFHAMGEADKGVAVRWVMDRFAERYGVSGASLPTTIALGDSDNDVEMLRAVDRPVVIPRAVGEPLDPGPLPNLLVALEPGPAGWRVAVDRILDDLRLATPEPSI